MGLGAKLLLSHCSPCSGRLGEPPRIESTDQAEGIKPVSEGVRPEPRWLGIHHRSLRNRRESLSVDRGTTSKQERIRGLTHGDERGGFRHVGHGRGRRRCGQCQCSAGADDGADGGDYGDEVADDTGRRRILRRQPLGGVRPSRSEGGGLRGTATVPQRPISQGQIHLW